MHFRISTALLLACLTTAGVATAESAHAEVVREIRQVLYRAAAAAAEQRTADAAAFYEQARQRAAALSESNLLLARALDGLADAHRCEGRFEEALELYEESAPMLESLLGSSQPRLATTLHNQGLTYLALGRTDQARDALDRALSIFVATFGDESSLAVNTRRALRDAPTAAASARGCPRRARPAPARDPGRDAP